MKLGKASDIMNTYQCTMNEDKVQYTRQNSTKVYLDFILRKARRKMLGKDFTTRDSGHENYKRLDNMTQYLYGMFHETILPTLLRNYDRYAMINGVEIRMPFMDHRLVSFVNSLPYSSKIGNGYTKRIVRDALDPYLPKEVTWRTSKVGFSSPIVDWMQNDLKVWFQDLTHSKDFLQSELIDNPEGLKNRISAIANKENNSFSSAQKCWSELSPYIWGEALLKKRHALVN